jgi:AcrR family transcriptional regulator
MTEKSDKDQEPARRTPRQARALHKVGLILEAASQLIDKAGLQALTTNAIAERAGVSIGSVYQYFGDKEAVLDALAERELGGLAENVMAALQGPPPAVPGGRIRAVVRAVLDSYGGRLGVHRQLLAHALSTRPQGVGGGRLSPLLAGIAHTFAATGVSGPGQAARPLSPEEAFVLTHAVAGVLRSLVADPDASLDRQGVEDALVRLVIGYLPAGQPG